MAEGIGLLTSMMAKSGLNLQSMNPKMENGNLALDLGVAELREVLFKNDPKMAEVSTIDIVNNRIKISFKLM